MSQIDDAFSSIVASHEKTLSQVSVKAVGSQLALMVGISLATILAFSFFRPREKKVYAPKIKYQLPEPANPLDDPDYEPPPPAISNGFFAWFSPVIHLKEEQMIANIGLDASTFLRFLRLLRNIFSVISVYGVALLVINIIYNLKYVNKDRRNDFSLMTIQNVKGSWAWPALAVSYLINFTVMYFVWRNWQAMVQLRSRWFRSPAYQSKIYSRTLMVTQVRKDFRSDQGLLALMGQLKVDGIKIGPEIDCTSIGRRLEDFPEMVEDHNKAVADLEAHLVKYLKHNKIAAKRPTMRKGGFMGFGGEKKDAIDYLAKEIKFLRDKIDTKRQAIDSLLRQERRARKGGQRGQRIEGENYGFVTFKTISEAHRIARSHQGALKELHGARLSLAPMPHDIVWQNIAREPAELASRKIFGFAMIGVVCFFNTVPLLIVSLLANLSSLTLYVDFLAKWKDAGSWGNWTFSIVSGVLPATVSFIFGYFLPIIMRKISKYQGAPTRSRLDRAVTARYFFFVIFSNLFVFSLLSVVYNAIAEVVLEIGRHQSASDIFKGLKDIPDRIQGTYVQQSTYWLTWLPLRGFLVIFELIQLIKLAMVSLRRFMFSHTPRDIREMTKPGYFEYAIVIVNLLFVASVGLIYAPLAPLVAFGACTVFWFSSVVYKYQLLYVYISRAESGGRMWNVYVNRLLAATVLMQLLMVLTTGLIRQRWIDAVAAAPPVLLMLAFKIYMDKTSGQQFKYYNPTPQEAEYERSMAVSEKRTRHSEMEKRFLHPALQADKLYTIMVHKQQEGLAKEVLSAYPWFTSKHGANGLAIKAVREENLEYDPLRDGARDEAHQAEWDARSVTSTDILGGGGGKSEFSTPGNMTPANEYGHYPLPTHDEDAERDIGTPFGTSNVNLPFDNPSSDYLLQDSNGGYQRRVPGAHHVAPSTDSISGAPLLQHAQETGMAGVGSGNIPYPPSAYTQPAPLGYTPPTMRRTASGLSDGSVDQTQQDQRGGATRWDAGNQSQTPSVAPPRYASPQGQYGDPYQDPYDQYYQPDQSEQGYRDYQDHSGNTRRPSQANQGYAYQQPQQYRRHGSGSGSG